MKTIQKIGLGALIIIIIILGSVKLSMDSLKKEAENALLEIAQLYANTFNEQITQLFTNINVYIDSLNDLISNKQKLDVTSKMILAKNPYIRSVYILDDHKKVIYSSNNSSIGEKIDFNDYYPKPMFDNSILRFGKTHLGRDFFKTDKNLSFIPVIRAVKFHSKIYYILFTINDDYFTNTYSKYLTRNQGELDIVRIDDTLLYSNVIGKNLYDKKFGSTLLFKEAVAKSFSFGIEEFHHKKVISSYYISDLYPLIVSVKLDYDKNLKSWDYKTFVALFFIGLIIISIAFIIISLLIKYRKAKEKEIKYQKQQIINQEKIRNAYIVYENSNDGILITDENANIIDVNKAFILNTGYELEEVYGFNPRLLKSGIHEKSFYEKMWHIIEEKNYWHGEVVNKRKDGHFYTELLTINRVLDKNKKVKNYIAVFTNITKEKEQERLLKEQEEFIFQQSKMAAMGEMLENIAHQWRQPLSIISTAATAPIMEETFGLKNAQNHLDRFKLINETAQYLSETIDDFSNFFKPDKHKKKFDVDNAIEHSLKILNSKFKNRNIQVIKKIENVELFGYESELVQVIMNLLNNARDALEQMESVKRFIFIKLYKQDMKVVLEVKDSGGGIPFEIISKVFEPYFTTKHRAQGTGIGLYMSEEIISKHMNGTIQVRNIQYRYQENIFVGAEFIIEIPL